MRRHARAKPAAPEGSGEPVSYEVGSDNVFADLGFADPDLEMAKAEVARRIAGDIAARGLTQARAAALLGIDQPRVSLIARGRTEDFSLERLLELVRRMDYSVNIGLAKEPAGGEHRRRLVVSTST